MADYIKKLKSDLVEQFKDRPNIEALNEVIGEQLDDLFLFFEQLQTKRSVNDAEGKQLDGVGDIVVLSRLEAAQMIGTVSATEMTDEQYRKYLIYKILRNKCNCTYYDIINSYKMFWDKPLYYSESPEYPATMILQSSELSIDDDAQKLLTAPFIKAAGVAIIVKAYTKTLLPSVKSSFVISMGRNLSITALPEIMEGNE